MSFVMKDRDDFFVFALYCIYVKRLVSIHFGFEKIEGRACKQFECMTRSLYQMTVINYMYSIQQT